MRNSTNCGPSSQPGLMATPRGRSQTGAFSAESAYRDDYRPPRTPAAQQTPASRPRLYIPFTGTSTSRDYRAFPREALLTNSVKRSEPPTAHIGDRSSATKFDWCSTSRQDFQYRQQQPSEAVKARSQHRLILPFTGQSTSRAEFRVPAAEVLRSSRPGSAALKSFNDRENIHVSDLLEDAKFEGSSSYSSEFKPIPLPVSVPPLEYAHSQEPPLRFEGVSESHSQYRSIEIDKGRRTPIDNKTFISSISGTGSMFEGTTEFRDSFKRIPLQKNDIALEPYVMDDSLPFEATTESRASYRPFTLSKDVTTCISGRASPVFEGRSSHIIDFVPYPDQHANHKQDAS